MFFAAEEDALAEDVYRNHLLRSDGGAKRLALPGEPLAGLDVELVLVLEAAEQPAASARDLTD